MHPDQVDSWATRRGLYHTTHDWSTPSNVHITLWTAVHTTRGYERYMRSVNGHFVRCKRSLKLECNDADTDTDILARIFVGMSAWRARVGEDPREEVGVGVGVVEFQLN